MRQFERNNKARTFTNSALGIAGVAAFGAILFQAMVATPATGQPAKKSTATQRIIPAPVTYWADFSNGGAGMMGGMPFAMGGQSNNTYGDAWTGSAGKHADLAIYNKNFPAGITANQAIPKVLKLGNSVNLLPTTIGGQSRETETVPKMPDVSFTMKLYWGCGAAVRPGQPRVIQIVHNQVTSNTAYSEAWQGRGEPSRRPPIDLAYSRWPNDRDHRNISNDASIIGNHTLSGNGVPTSLAYAIDNLHDFMGDLGLASSGDKSGNINFTWNSVANAKAYFVNAMGMRGLEGQGNGGEMVIWSASEVPDSGGGLLNYLSNANVARFLQERAILPATQTSCMSPRGIFANSEMVMAQGIAYGEETNLVYPPRPTDVNVPWVQEWTAQIRNKSNAMLMVGMPGMGEMMGGSSSRRAPRSENDSDEPANSSNNNTTQTGQTTQSNSAACENARQTGGGLGAALGRGIGQYRGGTLGRIAGHAIGGAAGSAAAGQTTNCQPPPAQPKGN
jgi:hypothetical protein